MIVERIARTCIQFNFSFSRDGDELFVTLGAEENIFMQECTYHMPFRMKRVYHFSLCIGIVQHVLPLTPAAVLRSQIQRPENKGTL